MPKFWIKNLWKPESVSAGRVASKEKIDPKRKGHFSPKGNSDSFSLPHGGISCQDNLTFL